MTKKKLLELLKNVPDHYEIYMGQRITDFDYGLVNSAYVKVIEFKEDESPDSEVLTREECFVLEEE